MEKIQRFITLSLDSSEHVAFGDLKEALSYSRLKLMRKWKEDKKQELFNRQISWEKLICDNYQSFQEALAFGNVRAQVEDVSIYICSDGAEFENEDAASQHEFINELHELAKRYGIPPVKVFSIAQEYRLKQTMRICEQESTLN